MVNFGISLLLGFVFGAAYGHMFLAPFLSSASTSGFSFKHVFGSFSRLVLITVAIIISIIYIELSFVWVLLGFMIAFWGAILGKIRAKQ